jgi:hypothetical protein
MGSAGRCLSLIASTGIVDQSSSSCHARMAHSNSAVDLIALESRPVFGLNVPPNEQHRRYARSGKLSVFGMWWGNSPPQAAVIRRPPIVVRPFNLNGAQLGTASRSAWPRRVRFNLNGRVRRVESRSASGVRRVAPALGAVSAAGPDAVCWCAVVAGLSMVLNCRVFLNHRSAGR